MSEILEQEYPLHLGNYCDLIYLSKDVNKNRVYKKCVQEKGIDIQQILSINDLLSFTSQNPILNDSSIIGKIKSMYGSIEEISGQIDSYFLHVKDTLLESIENAKANAMSDLMNLSNQFKQTLNSFNEASRIEDFQQVVISNQIK